MNCLQKWTVYKKYDNWHVFGISWTILSCSWTFTHSSMYVLTYIYFLNLNVYIVDRIEDYEDLPGGASGKEHACQCRKHKRLGYSPELQRSLKEGMVTHSSILAWRIPVDRGAWCATVHRISKSRTQLKWLTALKPFVCTIVCYFVEGYISCAKLI